MYSIFLFLLGIANAGSLCNDGTLSSSSGRGTCSHHGGVASDYTPSYEPKVYIPTPSSTASETHTSYDISRVWDWESEKGVNNFGSVFYSTNRSVISGTSDNYQFSTFSYTCYPSDSKSKNPGIMISLVVSESYFGDLNSGPFISAQNEADSVKVYAVKNNKAEYIFDWTMEIIGKYISFIKGTPNISQGSINIEDLTSEEIMKFVFADDIVIKIEENGVIHSYYIPMSGGEAEIKNTLNSCLGKFN